MKNVFKILAIIALALIIAFAFAACPDSPKSGGGGGGGGGGGKKGGDGHTHNWSVWAPAQNCTTPVTQERTCLASGCSNPTETRNQPALGHQGLTPAFAATCTTAGNSAPSGTCLRGGCGQVVTGTVIPVLGHNWNWGSYTSGIGLRQCQRGGCTVTAGIGDTGQGGGIIFYASSFTFYQTAIDTTGVTRYYLEAWTQNETEFLQWGDWGNSVGGITTFDFTSYDYGNLVSTDPKASIIGNGRKDTLLIVAHMTGKETNTAAQRASSETRGGRSDWFLPSPGELKELYKNRVVVSDASAALGGSGLGLSILWSSSQIDSNRAWLQLFENGSQYTGTKDFLGYDVRAVRAF